MVHYLTEYNNVILRKLTICITTCKANNTNYETFSSIVISFSCHQLVLNLWKCKKKIL